MAPKADHRRGRKKSSTESSDSATESPSLSELERDLDVYIRQLMRLILCSAPTNQNAPKAPLKPTGKPSQPKAQQKKPLPPVPSKKIANSQQKLPSQGTESKKTAPASKTSSATDQKNVLNVPVKQPKKTPPPALIPNPTTDQQKLLNVPIMQPKKTPPPASIPNPTTDQQKLLNVPMMQPKKTPPPASIPNPTTDQQKLLNVPVMQPKKTPPPASIPNPTTDQQKLLNVPVMQPKKTPPPASIPNPTTDQKKVLKVPVKQPKKTPLPTSPDTNKKAENSKKQLQNIQDKPPTGSRKDNNPPPAPPARPLPSLPPSTAVARDAAIGSKVKQRVSAQYTQDRKNLPPTLPGQLLLLHLQLKSSILRMEIARSAEEHTMPLPMSKDEAAKEKKLRAATAKAAAALKSTKRPAKMTVAELEAELFNSYSANSDINASQTHSQHQLPQQSTSRPGDEGVYANPEEICLSNSPKPTGSAGNAAGNATGKTTSKPEKPNSIKPKSQNCHHVFSQTASAASVPSKSVRIRGRLS